MSKILVVGNCQADNVAAVMKLLAPDDDVGVITFNHFPYFDSSPDRILERVQSADYVACQNFDEGPFGSLTSDQVKQAARSVITLPNITFNGYHPDIIYVIRPDGFVYPSPMDTYHSALILYGYSQGYDRDRILSLFSADTFHDIGYFSAWSFARDALLKGHATGEIDVAGLLRDWMRRGCFMHTINHPKLFVIEDIAKAVLAGLGIPIRPSPCIDFLTDVAKTVVWGVYPPLASRFGIEGTYLFKRAPTLSHLIQPLDEVGCCFDLRRFVETSVSFYQDNPSVVDHSDRIQYWLNEPRIRAALAR